MQIFEKKIRLRTLLKPEIIPFLVSGFCSVFNRKFDKNHKTYQLGSNFELQGIPSNGNQRPKSFNSKLKQKIKSSNRKQGFSKTGDQTKMNFSRN